MRYGSVCSGIEAASVAWKPLGWKPAWFSEIEPFPCAVLKHHYPDVVNLGDMTKLPKLILSGEIEAPDMLCGGTPCFTAGHMVLTSSGYKPIEQVCVGDLVMTHKGRLREVLRVGSKTAKVGKLSMVGHKGIICTPNHKFLSCKWESKPVGRGDKYHREVSVSDAHWVEAKNLPGKQWFSLKSYEHQETTFESAKFSDVDEKQLLIAGMYVGDGYIRRYKEKSKKNVMLCLNDKKLEFFNEHFSDCRAYIRKEKTAYKVAISDTRLANWLVKNFGEYSSEKRIPTWLLSHPKREAFLLGYIKTDGFVKGSLTQFSTVSKALAYGICDLMNSLDYACSAAEIKVLPKKVIEGRLVNQSNWWQIRAFKNSRKSRTLHGFLSRSVTSYEECEEAQTVYNIEVGEDNSYVVEGAVVHNCQAFSVAGNRKSLDDERGNLTLVFCEVANAIDAVRSFCGKQPSIILWENVPGVLNTKDNAFGCFLGELVGANAPLSSGAGRWSSAGYVNGSKRKVAWRTLDAQYFGVPQRRKRIFVVASARKDFDPAEILFERSSLSGDSVESGKTRQAVTGQTENSSGDSGKRITLATGQPVCSTVTSKWAKGCGGPSGDEHQNLVLEQKANVKIYENHAQDARYSEKDTCPTITSRYGTGGGNVPLVLGSNQLHAAITQDNTCTTLTEAMGMGGGHVPMVVQEQPTYALAENIIGRQPQNGGNGSGFQEEVSYTLNATGVHGVTDSMRVRRLTPVECERLQGFPDGYTRIPYRNKPAEDCPDSPRYKAIGNSMAVPVMRWIGERIQMVQDIIEGKK